MHQRYICVCVSVPLSPGFSMSQFWSECDKLWSTALLMWPDPVLHSCKRARPFFYGTPEWGRSVCVKDGVMGVMNEEEKHISSHCVWACTWHRLSSSRAGERLRLQRGESWPQICPTAAGGLPADCSPPLQCDHSGRWFFFFFPFHFLSPLHRKETRCRCLGNGTGGLQSSEADWKSRPLRVFLIVFWEVQVQIIRTISTRIRSYN